MYFMIPDHNISEKVAANFSEGLLLFAAALIIYGVEFVRGVVSLSHQVVPQGKMRC